MSYQAVQWAMDHAPMLRTSKGLPDTTARAVLIARAERADEQGQDSHASILDVVWRTGYDERTIQRAETRLETAGLLVRAGITRWGTPRWDLDMSKERDPAERAEMEQAAAERRAAEAERVRAYRAARRTDSASVRTHSESVRTDAGSVRTDAVPPEPPTNLPGNPPEPPPGGAPPPDPRRPLGPRSSDPGNGNESSLFIGGGQPPPPETATRDRARETEPALRLIAGTDNPESSQPNSRPLFPAAVPNQPGHRGVGFCLPCHALGKVTLAVDPVNGDACAHHLARSTA